QPHPHVRRAHQQSLPYFVTTPKWSQLAISRGGTRLARLAAARWKGSVERRDDPRDYEDRQRPPPMLDRQIVHLLRDRQRETLIQRRFAQMPFTGGRLGNQLLQRCRQAGDFTRTRTRTRDATLVELS